MISIQPLLFSAAVVSTSYRRTFLLSTVSAMSTSTSQSCSNNGKSAIVFLHGLGDSPAGWSHLEDELPSIRKNLGKDVHYVFPPAPTVGLTINGGMEMPGWFDLFDWPIGITAKDDRDGKMAAAQQIEDTIEKLESEMGIPPSRVVVGGFSQGGAVALLAAYHRRVEGRVPFAGCVCLSGWLTLKDELKVTPEVAKSTPLFWGHGTWDDKVLFEQQAHGVEKLRESGVDVSDYNYPMGHQSHPEEMSMMAEFVEKALFPKE
mmetsp:Transcript_33881/g.73306  ORF Transcript_33881/g.73306 Transcript_33881/m.73306 type:complete len:261 (-) Transcript_33881:414-1196(-)